VHIRSVTAYLALYFKPGISDLRETLCHCLNCRSLAAYSVKHAICFPATFSIDPFPVSRNLDSDTSTLKDRSGRDCSNAEIKTPADTRHD